jgi:hypothetical protein
MPTQNRIRTFLTLAVVAMVILILATTSANAGITLDGSVSWDYNAGTGTYDASGSDKLVVAVTGEHHFNNANGKVNSITYDGVALTLAVFRAPVESGTDTTANEIWYLDNPSTSTGTITVSYNGNNWVATALGLSNTAAGVGATAISDPNSKSVDLTALGSNSFVLAVHGMGGNGNTANVTVVDADAPAIELSALEIGNNWAGHVTSTTNGVGSGAATYSFTGGSDTGVNTIAAEFQAIPDPAQDPNLPTVDAGISWISWSGQAVTLDPNVVNNDEVPQRTLSYAWTASPADGVVFIPNDGGEGSTSSDLAPSVTITKAASTGDATIVTLTLAVTLEGEEPVLDTTTIDVYDDACKATKALGLAGDNPADFDENCIIGYGDLAEMAAKWLNNGGLTEPIVTPVTVAVPDVTGGSESAAQSILTGLGLTTSSTYQYDEFVPLNDVISQNPIAGSVVVNGSNVSLVVSNGPPPVSEVAIAGVYLAQTHVLPPNDPLFKLVGNRPALLKVQVVGPDSTPVPPVTAFLSVDNDSTILTLDAPDRLPGSFEAELGKVQHRYDDSFTTLIPAQWIRPGLDISITAGAITVNHHNIKVGAPTEVKMKMFDVHYFGLGDNDYPAGTFDELEAKWPVSSLDIERIRDIDFYELVVPARGGAPNVRVTSKQDYTDQTGLPFDGEQAAALQWVEALSASGGNFDVAMQYINIIGVSAGGQAGGFDGVGGVSVGILNHELGHALSLPHWGDNSSYPYKGEMYGIEPQPGVYMGTHVGPTWAFDLPTMTFIPPTVQENSVGGEVGYYKKNPMQGGGTGDQEVGFLMRHFSDYCVNKMQSYLEGKVAVLRGGNYYKWNNAAGDYTTSVASDGVRYPIEQDVQVISVMASTTLSDMNVNMVYPPIGPYEGNRILTFDPTSASDRTAADAIFCPSGGCDFTLRVVQGGQQKTYMLAASGTEGSDPYSAGSLKTAAVNLRASDGAVTQVELLLTPNAEKVGLPGSPEVLHTWTD